MIQTTQTFKITYYKQGKLDVRRTIKSHTKHYLNQKAQEVWAWYNGLYEHTEETQANSQPEEVRR